MRLTRVLNRNVPQLRPLPTVTRPSRHNLPRDGHGAVSLEQPGQLDEDVVESSAKTTPLGVIKHQHVLEEQHNTKHFHTANGFHEMVLYWGPPAPGVPCRPP